MENTYYTVFGWMKGVAKKLTVRCIFALVWSYTIKEKEYFSTMRRTADYFGISEGTAASAFDELTKAGYLVRREERTEAGALRIFYAVAPAIVKKHAEDQLQKLRSLYAKFAVADHKNYGDQPQILRPYKETDNIPSSPKGGFRDRRAREAHASAPSLFPDPVDDEPEVLTPEVVEPAEHPTVKDEQPAAGEEKKKNSAKRKKEPEQVSPEFAKFCSWIDENAPAVAKMKEPFTELQFDKIRSEYSSKEVADVLEAMGNYVGLGKKFVSAYLTCRNWLRRRHEAPAPPAARPASRPAPTPSKFDANMQAVADAVKILNSRV